MEEIKNLNRDKIEFIKHMYEWTQQITHFADRKVSALQIINTLIISFSATFSIKDLSPVSKMCHHIRCGIGCLFLSNAPPDHPAKDVERDLCRNKLLQRDFKVQS